MARRWPCHGNRVPDGSKSQIDERLAVRRLLKRQLALSYGISRPTLDKWLQRYATAGLDEAQGHPHASTLKPFSNVRCAYCCSNPSSSINTMTGAPKSWSRSFPIAIRNVIGRHPAQQGMAQTSGTGSRAAQAQSPAYRPRQTSLTDLPQSNVGR